ncbi:MAG: VanZ family protein [Chitinophagaceae bacterium]
MSQSVPSPAVRWAKELAILWTIGIFVACLWPGKELPKTDIPFADKWTHLILFGGFALLWLRAYPRGARLPWLLTMAVIATAVGTLVELFQGWFPSLGRSRDVYDALADGIGGVIGVIIFGLSYHYFLKKNN